MKARAAVLYCSVYIVITSSLVQAQSVPSSAADTIGMSIPPDVQWKDLLAESQKPPTQAVVEAGRKPTEQWNASREALQAGFIALADRAKAFHARNGSDPHAPEAKRLEARYRLSAALLGEGHPGRGVIDLASSVREDVRLSAEARYEIASLQEKVARRYHRSNNREAWIAEREAGARRLLREFPQVPAVYDELLHVAALATGTRAVALSQQIIDSSALPATKEVARTLLDRHTLNGRTLVAVIGGVVGSQELLKRAQGRLLVFYTWAPENEASRQLAVDVGKAAPTALIIAVNTSRNVAAALKMAAASKLPGEQLYGGRGFDSPVVRRLALTAPGLVYAVDREGVIENLSGRTDSVATLKHLNGEPL